jgi:hypothetical protein
MEDKNRINNLSEEELMRELIRYGKTPAPENLKYRIMQQIQTEQALKSRQEFPTQRRRENIWGEFKTIFGIMYAVLAVVAAGTFFLKGKEFFLSTQFWNIVIVVASVFSIFWMITCLDGHLREKKEKKLLPKKDKAGE